MSGESFNPRAREGATVGDGSVTASGSVSIHAPVKARLDRALILL